MPRSGPVVWLSIKAESRSTAVDEPMVLESALPVLIEAAAAVTLAAVVVVDTEMFAASAKPLVAESAFVLVPSVSADRSDSCLAGVELLDSVPGRILASAEVTSAHSARTVSPSETGPTHRRRTTYRGTAAKGELRSLALRRREA